MWASGTTNHDGEIVDATDMKVLPTEYFARGGGDGKQRYQPHFDEAHAITRQDQVQIFEELVKDADDDLTFSFIRRDHHVKDNRLLPQGWRKDGVPGIKLPANWLDATHPEGCVTSRPIRATTGRQGESRREVSHRAADRARPLAAAGRGDALVPGLGAGVSARARVGRHRGARCAVLLDNMALDRYAAEGWKLKIASAR